MRADAEIREEVVRELAREPQLSDADAIAVAVQDGAVTLTGHAADYAEKVAADRAAARVRGVRAVADDVQVRVPGQPRDDSDLARVIARILPGDSQIPEGAVRARVQSGWVTLEGEVEFDQQRRAVEQLVRNLRGVLAVTNDIQVVPR
jgi:osmotically-inducible protein OsmY